MPWYNDLRPLSDEKKINYGAIFPELIPISDDDKDRVKGDKKRIIEGLLRLRVQLNEIPTKTTHGNLILGSWNIQNFGEYSNRTPESKYYIAEIISRYDLIAIQEVKANLRDFNQIMQLLGSNYDCILNDITGGNAGNDERFAYIYDKRKVQFKGISGELVLWDNGGFPINQLKRTPLMTGFKAGWKEFAIINVHLHPDNSLADRALRKKEVESILKLLADRIPGKFWTENIFILGDMNIYPNNNGVETLLENSGFMQSPDLKGQPTSSGDQPYDRIYFNQNRYFNNLPLNQIQGGVFRYDQSVYRVGDFMNSDYQTYMLNHKGDPSNLIDSSSFESYYNRFWKNLQMSDHFPIWLEIEIDSSDNFLKEKKEQLG